MLLAMSIMRRATFAVPCALALTWDARHLLTLENPPVEDLVRLYTDYYGLVKRLILWFLSS